MTIRRCGRERVASRSRFHRDQFAALVVRQKESRALAVNLTFRIRQLFSINADRSPQDRAKHWALFWFMDPPVDLHFPSAIYFGADGWEEDNTLVALDQDRKSTRLNSSHLVISYAVFRVKRKKI